MEINKANNIKLNNNASFLGKEKKPVQEEREQVSSYDDKSANEAISNMGKAFINVSKNDNVELPQSIKEVLVRDKNDTDETFKQRENFAKKLYINREELALKEEKIADIIELGTTSLVGGENKDIKARIELADIMYFDKSFPQKDAINILLNLYEEHAEFTKELIENKNFPNEYVYDVFNKGADIDKDFR